MKYNSLSFLILRLGLGVVFLVFGIGKFQADQWVQTIHSMEFFSHFPWSVDTSVVLIGAFEIITGLALILGFFCRFFALMASCQLVLILVLLSMVGIQEIRNIGLLAGAIALFLTQEDFLSLDALFKSHRRAA
jgi:uncharacterized membrane protein YphA (DoxX/SURF4 family)